MDDATPPYDAANEESDGKVVDQNSSFSNWLNKPQKLKPKFSSVKAPYSVSQSVQITRGKQLRKVFPGLEAIEQ